MSDLVQDIIVGTILLLWWMLVAWLAAKWGVWSYERTFMFVVAGAVAIGYAKEQRIKNRKE